MSNRLPRAEAFLRQAIDHGEQLGCYLTVWKTGSLLCDLALGVTAAGRPATVDDIGALRCCTKPVIAAAVVRGVQDDRLHYDDRLDQWLPEIVDNRLRAITLRKLLSHMSGLPNLPRPKVYDTDLSTYVAQVLRQPIHDRWWIGPYYNATVAWHLVARVLELAYAMSVESIVESLISRPAGTSTLSLIDEHRAAGSFYRATADGGVEAYAESDPVTLATRANPAYGGFATNGDHARFYGALLDGLAGRSSMLDADLLRAAVRPAGSTRFAAHGRSSPVGLGFFLGNTLVFGGQVVPAGLERTFGHAGSFGRNYVGFAAADPDTQVVVVMRLNTIRTTNARLLGQAAALVATDLGLAAP